MPSARLDTHHEVQDLAAHILDQGEVDWSRVGNDVRLAEPETLDGLRLLEDLARGFRHTLVGADTASSQRSAPVLFRFAGLEVRERIGRGGQGEVYRAYDPLLDQEVALKLRAADSDVLAHQFIAEARRLVRIRHPNVVSVFGAAMDGGRVGLWMERVRGETLAARLAQSSMAPEEAVVLAAELCAALAAVHRHGLVHGDVKAENVLCEPGGRVVLADFGAAREANDTSSLSVSGTLRYLAPELLHGAAATASSDLYALGVLLYRAISGAYPRRGESLESLTREHESEPLVPLRTLAKDVPRALARVVERCLATDPCQRPDSALALARQLEKSLAPPRQRGVLLGVAAAVALLAVGALAALFLPHGGVPWHTELDLYRRGAGAADVLASGMSVRRGDGLQLSWRSDAQTWLYVLDDDGTSTAVLFPLAGAAAQNPLPAGVEQGLPRDGSRSLAWTISGDNAREEILVIASRKPLPQLDTLIADWQRSIAPPPGERRGASALRPSAMPGAVDSAALERALQTTAGQAGVRNWRYVLPHAD
jgi:tRNA A-37 threonylcarbamoyl transferase component Bud32